MPDKKDRIYWDACVFLVYLNGEEAERCEIIDQLFEQARKGTFEIVTSVVTEVEVAFGKAEQDGKAPDETLLAAIEAFWSPESPVELIEFHRLIGQRARDLVRDARLDRDDRLTPLDAVHLASAERVGATQFHTFDGPLLGFKGEVPFAISEPWTPSPRISGWGKSGV